MKHTHDERGMTTSEYAVGTLGAVSIGATLLLIAPTLFQDEVIRAFIGRIVDTIPVTGLM